MKNNLKIKIALTFIWIGFICAISFMEAGLKFQAPNITTALALGIGQLVFDALNKVELCIGFSILGLIIIKNIYKSPLTLNPSFAIAFLILMIQTFWLLPILDKQASYVINDIEVEKSYHHIIYIAFEVIKVGCLFTYGINKLKNLKK